MTEISKTALQPTDRVRPTALEMFNAVGLYNVDGLPLYAREIRDYAAAGGLQLEPYRRGDSPSREQVDIPYNATWFSYLRKNYGGALQLLGELRQGYSENCTTGPKLDGHDIMTVYHMGVQLPQFLLWRQDEPYRNGEIPAAPTVLRQALLGVGTVLLEVPVDKLPRLSGQDIVNRAEAHGDLVGDPTGTEIPRMVCPAAPAMIRGLGQALLEGGDYQDTNDSLLREYSIDITRLRDFASFMHLYNDQLKALQQAVIALHREPATSRPVSRFQKPQSKLERYDQLTADFCDRINEQQVAVYAALARTDTPRLMNTERLYRYNNDLRMTRTLFEPAVNANRLF